MRCAALRCDYNSDGYCSQPDYATIDRSGACTQMCLKTATVTEKYLELKKVSDEAYKSFDFNPNKQNSDIYAIALHQLQDFCVDVLDAMVKEHPEITDKITWEDC